jgi:hypothetical protein
MVLKGKQRYKGDNGQKTEEEIEQHMDDALQELLRVRDLTPQQQSDIETIVRFLMEYGELKEPDAYLRFMDKTDLTRGDQEIVGPKGLSAIRRHKSDHYYIMRDEFILKNGIPLWAYKEWIQNFQEGAEFDEYLWNVAESHIRSHPPIFKHVFEGFERSAISKKRKGRHETVDMVTARPHIPKKEKGARDRIKSMGRDQFG